jgi:chromosome segregation ATPase
LEFQNAMPDEAKDDNALRLEEANKALEARLADMESRLLAERQKGVEAEIRRRGDEAASANVENALKDMQDKLRREKREQELEAARQAAEARARDLDRRLNEERDMWVTMMKEHLARGGDTKPLLQEIAALKTALAAKDEQVASLKEQALKGGGDQKMLEKEISSLKDLLEKQGTALSARDDEAKLLAEKLSAKDRDFIRREQELTMQVNTLNQALAEKEAETIELSRQAEALRADAGRAAEAAVSMKAVGFEEERAELERKMRDQQDFQARLALRVQELEKDVGGREALIQAVRADNEALQKKATELTVAKDAEARLMRENLQRLGRQNKELLGKLQEAVSQAESAAPSPLLGAVPGMQDMLSGLEDALQNRDKMLEDQQRSIDEKRGLIEGLFNDLRSLDEQAVALLEEKGRQTQEMNERLASLSAENDRLKRLLEARPPSAPEAGAAAPEAA